VIEKAVANFFAPLSKKEPEAISWRIVNSTLLVGKYCPHPVDKAAEPPLTRRKVAAFDLVSPPVLPKGHVEMELI